MAGGKFISSKHFLNFRKQLPPTTDRIRFFSREFRRKQDYPRKLHFQNESKLTKVLNIYKNEGNRNIPINNQEIAYDTKLNRNRILIFCRNKILIFCREIKSKAYQFKMGLDGGRDLVKVFEGIPA